MARRIVIAVLALMAAVLGVVAVPLGLVAASQDMHDFRDEANVSASTVANTAEERLDDGRPAPALDRTIRQLSAGGDLVGVVDGTGRRIAGTPGRLPASSARISHVMTTGRTASYPAGGRFVVVAPVLRDSGRGSVGAVVLARSTAEVSREIGVLWGVIAAIAGAGLAAGGAGCDRPGSLGEPAAESAGGCRSGAWRR